MEKRILILMIMVSLLMPGCSLFKNTTKEKTSSQNDVMVEVEKETQIKDNSVQKITVFKDEKSGTETTIEVTGDVRIAADGVITGKTAIARIKRKDTTKTIYLEATQLDIKTSEKVDSVFKQKNKKKSNITESEPSSKTYWFAIGGIILFGLFLWGLNRLK